MEFLSLARTVAARFCRGRILRSLTPQHHPGHLLGYLGELIVCGRQKLLVALPRWKSKRKNLCKLPNLVMNLSEQFLRIQPCSRPSQLLGQVFPFGPLLRSFVAQNLGSEFGGLKNLSLLGETGTVRDSREFRRVDHFHDDRGHSPMAQKSCRDRPMVKAKHILLAGV